MDNNIEISRIYEQLLTLDAASFRVVTILGPRQSGKTTLAKKLFPNYSYATLEDPDLRRLAVNDPRTFLSRFPSPAIFDEVQRVPELLSYIQGIVDEHPDRKGQYILTGSHQPILQEQISQTLAGRTSILTLLPLSFGEVIAAQNERADDSPSDWIYRGFMPEIYRAGLNPTRTYQAYLQTYVERDVRQLIQLKDLLIFDRFLRLLAGRVGQLVNFDSLASDVGVSPKTIREWISVLEASFIVMRIPPYFKNFGKRLVKTPKVYFVDVGLASHLLGIESAKQVERDPLYGNLFENMVIMEFVKLRAAKGQKHGLYFYRDSHGNEIDILTEVSRILTPIEIKTSGTFQDGLLKSLNYYQNHIDTNCIRSYLIYSGISAPLTGVCRGLHFTEASQAFIPSFES
jgi:predicted AAA+ superfamily ATPase